MRNPGVDGEGPWECPGTFLEIPGILRVSEENSAIYAICRLFLKNCFYPSDGNRSTDRFSGGNTAILP